MVNGEGQGQRCVLCDVAEASLDHWGQRTTELVVAYVDGDLIALIEPDSPGVLLAPRSHVTGLSRMASMSGVLLAALRNAMTVVQSAYGAPRALVEPTTELLGAGSHVCFRVVPTGSIAGDEPRLLSSLELAKTADDLAKVLGGRFVPR